MAEDHKDLADTINNIAVRNIANICRDLNCWLIHISTDYVFDGLSESPYKESDNARPIGFYGLSKLNGEKSVISSGCLFLILRTSWVYSEYGSNFLKTILKLSQNKKDLRIVSDQISCPTYSQDVAKTIVKILPRLRLSKSLSGIYHFSGNSAKSWFQFSKDIIRNAFDLKIISYKPNVVSITSSEFLTKAKRPMNSQLDCTKFTTTFKEELSDYDRGILSSLKAIN